MSLRPTLAARTPELGDDEFARLLTAAQAGSGESFETLYMWLAPAVGRFLRFRGESDPEDLTSEVFVGILRNIRTFAGTSADFRTWVFSVTNRRLIDQHRRNGRRPTIIPLEPGEGTGVRWDVEAEVLGRLSYEHVEQLCTSLVPAQRDVLLLRLLSGMTIEQTATLLGRSIGGTKALQRRGLSAIRRSIEQGRPAPNAPL